MAVYDGYILTILIMFLLTWFPRTRYPLFNFGTIIPRIIATNLMKRNLVSPGPVLWLLLLKRLCPNNHISRCLCKSKVSIDNYNDFKYGHVFPVHKCSHIHTSIHEQLAYTHACMHTHTHEHTQMHMHVLSHTHTQSHSHTNTHSRHTAYRDR